MSGPCQQSLDSAPQQAPRRVRCSCSISRLKPTRRLSSKWLLPGVQGCCYQSLNGLERNKSLPSVPRTTSYSARQHPNPAILSLENPQTSTRSGCNAPVGAVFLPPGRKIIPKLCFPRFWLRAFHVLSWLFTVPLSSPPSLTTGSEVGSNVSGLAA